MRFRGNPDGNLAQGPRGPSRYFRFGLQHLTGSAGGNFQLLWSPGATLPKAYIEGVGIIASSRRTWGIVRPDGRVR